MVKIDKNSLYELKNAIVKQTNKKQSKVDKFNNANLKSVFHLTGTNIKNISNLKNIATSELNNLYKTYTYCSDDNFNNETNYDTTNKITNEKELEEAKQKTLQDIDKNFSYENILKILDNALNINGQIDERVQQQGTGDCYFLTTLNTLSNTKAGQNIIKDSISYNPDDKTYSVTFKGIGQTYTFTEQEIIDADLKNHDKINQDGSHVTGEGKGWYSEGDNDALLMEMAFEKFRLECSEGKFDNKKWPKYATNFGSYNGQNDKSALNGGTMKQVLFALTGKGVKTVKAKGNKIDKTLNKLEKGIQNGKSYAIYASVSAKNGYKKNKNGEYYLDNNGKFQKVTADTPANVQRYDFKGSGENNKHITLQGVRVSEGQKIDISNNSSGSHALAITKITDDTVTIINPWDSDKEITVKREDFETYVNNIEYADLGKKGAAKK